MATILIHPTLGSNPEAVRSLAAQTGTVPVNSASGRHLRLERTSPMRRRPHSWPFEGDAA